MQRPSADSGPQEAGSHRGAALQSTESYGLSCCLTSNIMDIKKKKKNKKQGLGFPFFQAGMVLKCMPAAG